MYSRIIEALLLEVTVKRKLFNDAENHKYPKINQLRKWGTITVIISALPMVLFILGFTIKEVQHYQKVFFCFFLLFLFIFGIVAYSFNQEISKREEMSSFEKQCRYLDGYLEVRFKENVDQAVDMLMEDLMAEVKAPFKKYENFSESFWWLLSFVLSAIFTVTIDKIFNNRDISISLNVALVVISIIILWKTLDSSIRDILKAPIFGKKYKKQHLLQILKEIKYIRLK